MSAIIGSVWKEFEVAVDWTKPLELTDGTPVTLTGYDHEGDPVIDLPRGTMKRLGLPCEDYERCYLRDGTHLLGTLPDIRNRA